MKTVVAALVLVAAQAMAVDAADRAADDALIEARVMQLAATLRCPVCQNQTVADSNAPLAEDLRGKIREQLRAGLTQSQVTEHMLERYGDFVLYRPRLRASTLLLWIGPLVLVAVGLLLLRQARGRAAAAHDPPLDDAARARARALLAGGDRGTA